jgi:predicted acyl esterase
MATNGKDRPSAGLKIQDLFPDVIFSPLLKPKDHPLYNYQGFKPGEEILDAGHTKALGCKPFEVKTVFDRDHAIVVRDGKRLYADIFRPETSNSQPIPAILPWSPYGKTGTGPQSYDLMAPHRAAIPRDRTSGYEKFEAPDPAEWTARGYAVINIDARGAGDSEGIIAHWGVQEAEDIYDVITWLSEQLWCNGSVVMAGNSWLAISQINFASRLQHPALKAIAPWESYNDPYRHFVSRGGRPHIPSFHKMIAGGFAGPEGVENMVGMLEKHPLYDDYWEAKRIPVENIDGIPLYVLASYSSMLHTYGSLETYRSAKTPLKWLRIHPYQECKTYVSFSPTPFTTYLTLVIGYDLYRDEVNDELQRYFDRYAKNVDNGWEKSTPAVRLSLLGFEDSPAETVLEREEHEYPLKRQQLRTFFLDLPSRTLKHEAPTNEANATYEAHHLTDCLVRTIVQFNAKSDTPKMVENNN